MGEDKGFLDLNGKPMIQHVIDAVKKISDEIVISTSNPDYQRFKYPLVKDFKHDAGPLSGIYSGMKQLDSKRFLILTCDAPFVKTELLSKLLEYIPEYQICYPSSPAQNQTYPLTAAYDGAVAPLIKAYLEKENYRVKTFIQQLKTKAIELKGIQTHQLKNINTRDEYESSI